MNNALPMPRLQITWTKTEECEYHAAYELIVPLDNYDIRNEAEIEGGEKPGCIRLPMSGGTKVGSSVGPILQDGVLDTPFRDGVHLMRDAVCLGLPAFVVYGDVVRRVNGSKEINQVPAPDACIRLRRAVHG